MDQLIWPKNVGGSDTGPIGANIEGFGEFDELGAGGVGTTDEDWHL